jgi:membrane protease YdiL (CAAX protease family)
MEINPKGPASEPAKILVIPSGLQYTRHVHYYETTGVRSLTDNHIRLAPLATSILLAVGLWFFSFAVSWGNFWLKISASVALLAGLSFSLRPSGERLKGPNRKDLGLGLLSALLLYLIFVIGQRVSTALFPFATHQIAQIYAGGHQTPGWVMACLSLFITGPGEEIYWRGYVQGHLMQRFGQGRGWLMATLLYTCVHVWSFNFMLVAGAALAGAFWGAMYVCFGRLWPVIICHSLWSAAVFWLLPLA